MEPKQLPAEESPKALPEASPSGVFPAVPLAQEAPPRLNEEWTAIKRRWEGSIGHPRRLIASARAVLEDAGYTVRSDYNDRAAPVRDTSYFEGEITARQEQRLVNPWLMALGVLTLPLVMGYWIIKGAFGWKRSLIQVEFEGESYYVGAREERSVQAESQGRSAYAERAGVVSDVRLTLRAGSGPAKGGSELKKVTTSSRSPMAAFTLEVADELEALWPQLAVPGGA